RAASIAAINKEGLERKAQIEGLQNEIEVLQKTVNENATKIAEIDLQITAKQAEINNLRAEKTQQETDLEKQIADFVIPEIKMPDTSELKAKKAEVQAQINELNAQLSTRSQIESAAKRIAELESRET